MAYRILDERDLQEVNGRCSNALLGKLSGEVVRADDVSPLEHELKVRVFGINRLKFATLQSFIATSTYKWISALGWEMTKGTYFFSGTSEFGTTVRVWIYNSTGLFINIGSGESFVLSEKEAESITDIRIVIEGLTSGEAYEGNIYPIISTFETDYTPWVDPSTVTVRRCGKNLVGYTGTTRTDTQHDISVTRSEKSAKFIINGTATEMSSIVATSSVILPPGEYAVSVDGLNSVTADTDRIYLWNQQAGKVIVNGIMQDKPKTFILTEPTSIRAELVFSEGSSYNNKTVTIQIEHGSEVTCFEEYNCTEYNPSSDGVIEGVTSHSPTMTLLTDTEGVTVECEYVKDANVVIEKLTNAVIALGGSV